MEASATTKYVRVAPRKVRIVADQVRGKPVGLALETLEFVQRKGRNVVRKTINSALSNAKTSGDVNIDDLYVREIRVDEGPTLRRFRPRAMGRATRIRKRTSHVTVVLDVW